MKRHTEKSSTRSESAKVRRQRFLRKLKFYSSAAGLGAFACSPTAQGAISHFDVPDVTITNNGSGVSQFIDIDVDGGGPEWTIIAPGAQNQIRVSSYPLAGAANDERGAHVGLPGGAIPAPSVPGAGEGNQILSLFGNPGSINPEDANPGYYVESVPAWTDISRSTLSPTFYADVAARGIYSAYNRVDVNRYVGLQWDFDGTGDVRYGWAQIDVNPPINPASVVGFWSATLTAFAIEMTPNTPIHAGEIPEPGSLALLAAGGGGLALARRRRRRQS
jgi:hypothetical protein